MADVFVRIKTEFDNSGIAKADKALGGLLNSMLRGSVALTAFGLAVKGAFDFVKAGANLEYLGSKFENLAHRVGMTSGALLVDLNKATRGMLSDSEAMAQATDLMALGLAKTTDEVLRLTRVSSALGMDMNNLVLTLTNQTTRRFDTLGVSVDGFKEKVDALKASGLSVQDAFTEAFLQQAEAQIEIVGDKADTSAGKMQRAEVAIKNFWDSVKLGAVEAVFDFQKVNDIIEDQTRLVYIAGQGFVHLSDFAKDAAKSISDIKPPRLTTEDGDFGSQWKNAAEDAQAYFDIVNTGLADQAVKEREAIEFGQAGGRELTDISALLLQNAKDRVSAGEDEAAVWAEYGKNIGLVGQEAVGLDLKLGNIDTTEAQARLVALGVPVAEAAQRAEDLAAGLDLISMKEVTANVDLIVTGDTWIATLLGFGTQTGSLGGKAVGSGGGSAAKVNRMDKGASGGVLAHMASGGILGATSGIVEVGEEGTEALIWDEELQDWVVVPHGRWARMKRKGIKPGAGMKAGSFEDQYVGAGGGLAHGSAGHYEVGGPSRQDYYDAAGITPFLSGGGGTTTGASSAQQVAKQSAISVASAAAGAGAAMNSVNRQISAQQSDAFTQAQGALMDEVIKLRKVMEKNPKRTGEAVAQEIPLAVPQ